MGEEAKKRLAHQEQSKDGLLMQKAMANKSSSDLYAAGSASQADLKG